MTCRRSYSELHDVVISVCLHRVSSRFFVCRSRMRALNRHQELQLCPVKNVVVLVAAANEEIAEHLAEVSVLGLIFEAKTADVTKIH